ncbi:MAG: hypothetical protein JNM57_13995 [Cyclobacteriaceae bacterium]|nr:hypothetical protein [Cyclobacteriaceae bacterium]
MTIKANLTELFPLFFVAALCSCGNKENQSQQTIWTKADSLTETYLSLHDSLHQAWNVMMHDENMKLKAMHSLLHEVSLTSPGEQETLHNLEERLEQLAHIRYTQEDLANAEVVEEYDFASNVLVSELTALAESRKEFEYNTTMQKLVNTILHADQRVSNYRQHYDETAIRFNAFIDKNSNLLKEIDQQELTKKPLFHMSADE